MPDLRKIFRRVLPPIKVTYVRSDGTMDDPVNMYPGDKIRVVDNDPKSRSVVMVIEYTNSGLVVTERCVFQTFSNHELAKVENYARIEMRRRLEETNG